VADAGLITRHAAAAARGFDGERAVERRDEARTQRMRCRGTRVARAPRARLKV
jgi:hypothetical protein